MAAALPGAPANAHHSVALFDYELPTDLEGTVIEFKYTNPHSTLPLRVRGQDGHSTIWNLEGMSPTILERVGWSNKTLKPGDQIKVTVWPLRSGAAGGNWSPQWIKFLDGKSIP